MHSNPLGAYEKVNKMTMSGRDLEAGGKGDAHEVQQRIMVGAFVVILRYYKG